MSNFIVRSVTGVLARVGRTADAAFRHTGKMTLLALGVARATFTGKVSMRDVLDQLQSGGVASIPLVSVTAALSGIVTSQQGGYQFTSSIPLYVLGSVVTSGVILELGPVMTAIVVIGRVGARITAELGTMKVSEEIDALRTLGLDPTLFLVFPRVIALVLVMPLLTVLADLVGILGGLLVALLGLDLTVNAYLLETHKALALWDVGSGVLKSVVFALAVSLIACQRGLATHGGAEGVGRATTSAVVTSLFALVVLDALFTMLFNAFGR